MIKALFPCFNLPWQCVKFGTKSNASTFALAVLGRECCLDIECFACYGEALGLHEVREYLVSMVLVHAHFWMLMDLPK